MTVRDVLTKVQEYFLAADVAAAGQARRELADMLAELDIDNTALLTPTHCVYCVSELNQRRPVYEDLFFYTAAEADAFRQGDGHGDPDGGFSDTFITEGYRETCYGPPDP